MVNISETGLQFSSPVKLKHNQIITMDINLARQGAQIQALGRVVWAKRISDSTDKLYRVGIQFLELSKEAAAIIRLYVYSPLAA